MATRADSTRPKSGGGRTLFSASEQEEELKRLVKDPLRAALACTENEAQKRLLLNLVAKHNLNYLRRRNMEEWLRPLVPEAGDARDLAFWTIVETIVLRDWHIQKSEFDHICESEPLRVEALLRLRNPNRDDAVTPPRTGRRNASSARSRDQALVDLCAEVRSMKAEGLSQLQMCERLDANNWPRPENAKWRHLTWRKAFRSEKYGRPVKVWLSKAANV